MSDMWSYDLQDVEKLVLDRVPEGEYALKNQTMRFVVLDAGETDLTINLSDYLVDINFNPVNQYVAWNSDKSTLVDVPADSFAVFPKQSEVSVRVSNFLPGFLIEYEENFWLSAVEQELPSHNQNMEMLGYEYDPVVASLGRAGMQLLFEGASASEPADALALEAIGTTVLGRVIKRYGRVNGIKPSSQARQKLPRQRMRQVREYIESALGEPITLLELANLAGMSSSTFSNAFKQEVGISPLRYVVTRRVDRAKMMLVNTEASVAQVAYACGFSGQSHLTRMFRDLTGATPAAYRRSHP